uniref:RING-type domain-containing protein n=1 Tax=Sinocyclocheilus grahami TaxID=75366 RepID=A0A672KAP8_SINGR
MATSAEDRSVLEEELTCPVCLDLYRDPHLLPCGHNFCLPCLRRLKSRSDHGRLRCPECRQSHRSSANWQKNFKLANIADGFRRRGQSELIRSQSVLNLFTQKTAVLNTKHISQYYRFCGILAQINAGLVSRMNN